MKKAIVALMMYLIITFMANGSAIGQGQDIKVGDYVEFGSYWGARILWRVMEMNGDNPILWSEYILCAKCFDAAESGKAGEGADPEKKQGSSLWSKSNLREWLNTAGKVNWTTYPPIAAATYDGESYDKEPGFLTGFSKAERDMLVPTERVIIGSYFHREIETTQDLVFLATAEEVQRGGKWGLDDDGRTKFPTAAALAKYNYMASRFKKGFGSDYFLMTPDDYQKGIIEGIDFGGANGLDARSPCSGSIGIVPAVQISGAEPKSGDGSKKNPWRF